MNLKVALEREVGVLSNLYHAGFFYVLWMTGYVIWGHFVIGWETRQQNI